MKQSSVRVLEEFRKIRLGKLTPEMISICDDIIADPGCSRFSWEKPLDDYLISFAKTKKLSLIEVADKATHMDHYIALGKSLLFAYPDKKPNEKYYTIAPDDFESVIVVLSKKMKNSYNSDDKVSGLVLVAKKFVEDLAWYNTNKDRSSRMICVQLFSVLDTGELGLIYDASFLDSFYPRYSLECPQKDCGNRNEINLFIDTEERRKIRMIPECYMNPKKEALCLEVRERIPYFGLSPRDLYAIAVECFDKWKTRPKRANTAKVKKYNDQGISAITVESDIATRVKRESFMEVPLVRYTEYVKERRACGWHVENRLSPREHERSAHTRTLKSGKVVFVRSTTVNKGNRVQVIHKI